MKFAILLVAVILLTGCEQPQPVRPEPLPMNNIYCGYDCPLCPHGQELDEYQWREDKYHAREKAMESYQGY